MTASETLLAIGRRGGTVAVVAGDRLAVTPATILDAELRAALRQHRRRIVAALTDPPPDPTTAPDPCPTCGGGVYWRWPGEDDLRCSTCHVCPDRQGCLWYLAGDDDDEAVTS